MDPKLLYWTAALVDLGAVSLLVVLGLRWARRGEIARHRRAMRWATGLVVAFLLSYVGKLAFLGREAMHTWGAVDVWVLRAHETFVLLMLLGGAVAWWQVRRLKASRLVSFDPEDPLPPPEVVRRHRLAGRTAVVGAVVGFVLAIGVLVGMYVRAFGV